MKLLIGGMTLIAMGVAAMFFLTYNGTPKDSPPRPEFEPLPEEQQESGQDKDKTSQFGVDRVKDGQDAKPAAFDGQRAMKYLKSICDLGPRVSGTKQMIQQQELIKKHFEALGAKVTFQSFEAKQNSVKGKIPMTNIIVSYQPEKKR